MSFVSMEFLWFVLLAATGYYLIPKKFQWMWLLLFSYIYYVSFRFQFVVFLLFSTLTTYAAGIWLKRVSGEKREKCHIRTKKRRIVALTLVLNFGMLAALKYTNFTISNINDIFGTQISLRNLILPLGISFYTFQSMGYLLDVYWEKVEPERNPFRFALFISFFPQIMQGPIGRFNRLSHQFFEKHSFDLQQAEYAVQLIAWGFFKKMVLADNAAIFVNTIFGEYEKYNGLAVFGVLAYSIQLYGDFSGGIDVVTGVASLFGIRLDENFKRPFFARSITDFWHRWHITLGTWMKDYIFYPLSLSKGMGKIGKWAKKRMGKTIGRALPICIANIVVFLVVGVWHGAAWKYIAYGLYNGLIIAFSGLMIQNYRKWKKALHVNDKSNGFVLFQIVRTFVLVNISWFFDRADTVGQAFVMMKNAITQFNPGDLWNIAIGTSGTKYNSYILLIIIAGCIILFLVSLFQEKGVSVRTTLAQKPLVIRWAVYLALIFALPLFGQPPSLSGGFIYAQF